MLVSLYQGKEHFKIDNLFLPWLNEVESINSCENVGIKIFSILGYKKIKYNENLIYNTSSLMLLN